MATTPGENGGISYTADASMDGGMFMWRPDGRTVRMAGPFTSGAAWDPTGTRIAFTSGDGWCGSSVGGAVHRWPGMARLARVGCRTYGLNWSPDGDRLAYFSGGFDIFNVDADGRPTRHLTPIGRNVDPAWAPNGRHIVFVSRRDGNWELYRMAPNGSSQERLSTTGANEGEPDVSPNSRSVVFVRGRDVWIRNLTTAAEVRVTRSKQVEASPIWSPDGRFIAFIRPANGRDTIRVRRLADSNTKIIARERFISNLSWRPLCTLSGSASANWLRGFRARDLVCALSGNDTVWSGPANDAVFGGAGADELHGGPGDDVLVGGPGRDVLAGGPGRDLLNGRDGKPGDVLRGGPADLCRADPGDRTIGC